MSDDVFAGDIEGRLHRIDRRLRDAILDAQCRDWLAERPDRIGFARLGQARQDVLAATRRFNRFPHPDDRVWPPVMAAAVIAATGLVLLLAPGTPLTLAIAATAGILAGQAAVAVLFRLRVRRARRRGAEIPAPIDDPFLYADLTRRIEACAATARGGGAPNAAEDLSRALDWVAAARDELAGGGYGRSA